MTGFTPLSGEVTDEEYLLKGMAKRVKWAQKGVPKEGPK